MNTMKTLYNLSEENIKQLHQLFQNEWWTKDRTLEETRSCINGSGICIGLTDEFNQLHGFARIITDYTFKALIFDLIISKEYRGKGLGKKLMHLIKDHDKLKNIFHFELYCLPELEGFYESFGFSNEAGGVKLMRLKR